MTQIGGKMSIEKNKIDALLHKFDKRFRDIVFDGLSDKLYTDEKFIEALIGKLLKEPDKNNLSLEYEFELEFIVEGTLIVEGTRSHIVPYVIRKILKNEIRTDLRDKLIMLLLRYE
jgi:hypothetical protein